MKNNNIATLVVHAGNQENSFDAVIPSITTASTFIQPKLGMFNQFHYSRCDNPTRYAYEQALMALEQGVFATATSSGVAATALVMELLPKDAHVIVMRGPYGGTHRLFEKLRRKTSGLQIDYLDLNDIACLTAAIKNNTQLIWIETPTNPLLELVDIEKVCQVAKQHHILTCVDNTFATAWNQQPLTLGADIVMLSTSKYIGGHSDLIGGALITSSDQLAEKLDFIKTTIGAIASPFDAYLALRGLKTLDVRMERQCKNAEIIAHFLADHPKVKQVYYPGLASHPQFALAKKQMKTGGAVVTLQLQGNIDDAREFISKLTYFAFVESLGGVESMINHSASMSHGGMTTEERQKIGIHDTTLRLSIGIEDVNDLIEDLSSALK